jgi:hypothetical protein
VLSALRAPRRRGERLADERRCVSRRVATGPKSFCPSSALLEAALAVLSSAACRDISPETRCDAFSGRISAQKAAEGGEEKICMCKTVCAAVGALYRGRDKESRGIDLYAGECGAAAD